MHTSIVIPAFNRPDMLLRAIDSVLSQAVDDFELIVCDDGSTVDMSGVRAKVEQAGQRWISSPWAGVASARNRAISHAQGDWLCLLDSDDCWLPGKLEAQRQFHHDNPGLLISQTEERWFWQGQVVNKGKVHQQPEGDAFSRSVEVCCISSSSVMLHRSIFESCGPYDEAMPVCEDYDFWLRVSAKYQLGLVKGDWAEKYAGHAAQLSRSEPAMDRFRLYSLLKLLVSDILNEAQFDLAQRELLRKLNVLLTGAQKRLSSSLPILEQLNESLEKRRRFKDYFHETCSDAFAKRFLDFCIAKIDKVAEKATICSVSSKTN